MSNCIFCKIVAGDIPCYQVWEDDNHLAFLDINPIKSGHTIVIPKKHLPYVFDIEDEELGKLMIAAKRVAGELKKTFNPASGKVGVIVYGLDVDHTHIHLVPIDKSGDLSFSKSQPASKDELQENLNRINSS